MNALVANSAWMSRRTTKSTRSKGRSKVAHNGASKFDLSELSGNECVLLRAWLAGRAAPRWALLRFEFGREASGRARRETSLTVYTVQCN